MNKIYRIRNKEELKWMVYSTVLASRAILVQRVDTKERGSIYDSTKEEWGEAFHAPSSPYLWKGGDERIVISRR